MGWWYTMQKRTVYRWGCLTQAKVTICHLCGLFWMCVVTGPSRRCCVALSMTPLLILRDRQWLKTFLLLMAAQQVLHPIDNHGSHTLWGETTMGPLFYQAFVLPYLSSRAVLRFWQISGCNSQIPGHPLFL